VIPGEKGSVGGSLRKFDSSSEKEEDSVTGAGAITAARRQELASAGPAGPESVARRARLERGGRVSVARVYPDVNVSRPADYWDYDNLTVRWGYTNSLSFLK